MAKQKDDAAFAGLTHAHLESHFGLPAGMLSILTTAGMTVQQVLELIIRYGQEGLWVAQTILAALQGQGQAPPPAAAVQGVTWEHLAAAGFDPQAAKLCQERSIPIGTILGLIGKLGPIVGPIITQILTWWNQTHPAPAPVTGADQPAEQVAAGA